MGRYDGQYHDHMIHGSGVYSSAQGGWTYTGALDRDRPTEGEVVEADGRRFKVTYDKDCAFIFANPKATSKVGVVCDPASPAQLHAALSRAEAAEAELRTLKALLSEPDDTLQQHFAEWQQVDGFLQSLRKMGDKALREVFNAFSDVNKEAFTDFMGGPDVTTMSIKAMKEELVDLGGSTDGCLERADVVSRLLEARRLSENTIDEEEHGNKEHNPLRISKQGLVKVLAAKNVVLSEVLVDELMQRCDTDGDGEIDWHEFRTLVRSSSDLEMMFKGLPLERVLAACFLRGPANDALGPFFRQQHSDVVAAVRKAGYMIVKMTMDVIETQKKVEENQAASGRGAKFGEELKGGSFEAFLEGVTGLTGEPHPDLDW